MFSSRIPLPSLIVFCRSVRHMLEAGLTLARAVRQQADRGPRPMRPPLGRMADKLDAGQDFASALKAEARYFPTLFLALSAVGENTGKLPEVLKELEDYFTLQQTLWRQFIGQITWPAIQFVLAILVMAMLIWILGVIAGTRPGGKPMDPLGLGLVGGSGAVTFLCIAFGSVLSLFVLYWFIAYVLRSKRGLDGMILHIPMVGTTLHYLALARFSMGMYLTAETGMPVMAQIRLSMLATSNGAFFAKSAVVEESIRKGNELTASLAKAGLFPEDFLAIVETAEISGSVPEVLKRQAGVYFEDAGRKLKRLTSVTAGIIYAAVAVMIIWAIIQIYSRALAGAGAL